MRENEKPTEGNMPPVNAGEHGQQSPEQSPELLAREQERQRFREERARMAPPPQSRGSRTCGAVPSTKPTESAGSSTPSSEPGSEEQRM